MNPLRRTSRSLLGRAAAAAAVLAALTLPAPPALAAVFTTDWDPLFSGALSPLGWRGTATVDVDDSCLVTDGDKAVPAQCVAAAMLSATLEFYNATLPSPAPTSSSVVFGAFPAIDAVRIVGGDLNGIDTAGPLTAANVADPLVFNGAPFDLELDFGLAVPTLKIIVGGETVLNEIDPTVRWTRVRPTGVPEPTPLALMLGALTALAAVTLSRRARPPALSR